MRITDHYFASGSIFVQLLCVFVNFGGYNFMLVEIIHSINGRTATVVDSVHFWRCRLDVHRFRRQGMQVQAMTRDNKPWLNVFTVLRRTQ